MHLEPPTEQEIERAHRRGGTCRVTVVRDQNTIGITGQQLRLSGRQRGPQRGNRVVEPRLDQRGQVEVPLDHDCKPLPAHRIARQVEAVQMVPLGIRRGLGRVHVFRLAVAEGSTAEGDGPPGDVVDGEDQPIAKTIVVTRAILAREHETGSCHLFGLEAVGRQVVPEGVPRVGGVPEAEPFRGIVVDPATLEIGPAAIPARAAESIGKERLRKAYRLVDSLETAVARTGRGDRNAEAPCQQFDGLEKADLLVEHDELEDVATGLAPETVKKLIIRGRPRKKASSPGGTDRAP